MREYGDACVYGSFAQVYDTFMDNIDYPQWESYLKGLLQSYGVDGGLVLELGCGTGSMTELLAADGYDMIGVDNSEDMLEIAQEKRARPAAISSTCSRICGNLSCTGLSARS